MWYYGFLYSQQVNGTSNYVLVDKNITFEYTAVLQSRFSADTNDDSMQCNHGVVFCIHSNDYYCILTNYNKYACNYNKYKVVGIRMCSGICVVLNRAYICWVKTNEKFLLDLRPGDND